MAESVQRRRKATGWKAEEPTSDLRRGQEIICTPQRTDQHCGPPSLLQNGYLGLKPPERENDHSYPPSAKVKNEWSYTSIPPYAFVASTVTTLSLPLW